MTRRGRSEGSVYQTSDGRWRGAVDFGFGPDGRRVRRYVSARTRKEAHEALMAALRDRDTGLSPRRASVTVEAYLREFLEAIAPSVRPTTLRSYRDLIELHVLPALGRTRLARLSPADVERLMRDKLADGLSPRRVEMVRAVLRRALNRAVKASLVPRNVAAIADAPKVERRIASPLSLGEGRRLVQTLDDHPLRALFLIAMFGGLRSGELRGLRWTDIDLDAGEIHVRATLARVDGKWELMPPKSRESRRMVPIPPLVVEALRQHRQARLEERLAIGDEWIGNQWGLVFTTSTGQPLRGTNLLRTFRTVLERARIPAHYRLHDLRATYATGLIGAGVDIRTVQGLMGHASPSLTLQVYAGAVSQLHRQAALRVSDFLLGPQAEAERIPSVVTRES